MTELPPCASPYGYHIEDRAVTLPLVGREQNAEVGGVLLSTAIVSIVHDGVRLLGEASVTGQRAGASFLVTIPAGDYHAIDWRGGFPAKAARVRFDREKSDRSGLRKPDVALLVDPVKRQSLTANISFGLSSRDIPIAGARIENLYCQRVALKALRREILYSGAAAGKISLQYREFLNDMARSAFSQELSFDLAMGKDIGFRGARVRVERVSNTGISYVILKPLD